MKRAFTRCEAVMLVHMFACNSAEMSRPHVRWIWAFWLKRTIAEAKSASRTQPHQGGFRAFIDRFQKVWSRADEGRAMGLQPHVGFQTGGVSRAARDELQKHPPHTSPAAYMADRSLASGMAPDNGVCHYAGQEFRRLAGFSSAEKEIWLEVAPQSLLKLSACHFAGFTSRVRQQPRH